MEIMYGKKSNLIDYNTITGIYGDKVDLIINGIDFNGIEYDDEWTVKRFLNGYKFNIDNNILKMFNDLEITYSILNKKIKNISKGQFKLVLLVYSLLNIKGVIYLDYFDKGLSFKVKKRIINYLKNNYNKNLVVITNDLIFLSSICYHLIVFNKGKIVFNDNIKNIYKSNIKVEYPSIINFIKLANNNNAKLSYTVDTKELAKDIYRSVT